MEEWMEGRGYVGCMRVYVRCRIGCRWCGLARLGWVMVIRLIDQIHGWMDEMECGQGEFPGGLREKKAQGDVKRADCLCAITTMVEWWVDVGRD